MNGMASVREAKLDVKPLLYFSRRAGLCAGYPGSYKVFRTIE